MHKRLGHTGESLAKGHKDHEGTGASLLCEKTERTEAFQPGDEKAEGDLINVHKYLKEKYKKDRDGYFSMCSVTGPVVVGAH